MPYSLTCDTCEFAREISAEIDTYGVAKDHESEHPDHFVFIEQDA